MNELKEILQVLDERGITEFELEKEGIKLRICKSLPAPPAAAAPAVTMQASTPAPVPASEDASAPRSVAASSPVSSEPAVEQEPEATDGLAIVKSPIVGTFYRAPSPESDPFVSVGDRVSVGQVLCIVEAMKLMNEIESELSGEIVKVHQENGQPVQYGEPLFAIRPD